MEHFNRFDSFSRDGTNDAQPSSHRAEDGVAEEDAYRLNSVPTFTDWFWATWRDMLSLAVVGAAALAIWFVPPTTSRSFPVLSKGGQFFAPQYAYPPLPQFVPIWLSALLSGSVPLLYLAILQIKLRSFWDFNNAVLGLLTSLISAALFQVILKVLIGGFRPHFLATCAPRMPSVLAGAGHGFEGIMFDQQICTGEKKLVEDALTSWPSGHSTAAFAGFGFLFLYLNGKFTSPSRRRAGVGTVCIIWSPILKATLICGSLMKDNSHNWWDALAGAVIGFAMAVSSYRTMYRSVWDPRTNGIPLLTVKPTTRRPQEARDSAQRSA